MRGPSHLVSGFLDGSLPLPGQDEVDARLTELDRQLVRLLQADGRRSFAGMARDLGVPEKTVRRKVNQLLDDNVIQITAVADPALLGFPVMALVGLAFDGGQAVKPLMNSLAELPAVDYAVVTTGRYDALVEVLCRDTAELLTVVHDTLARTPGVGSAEAFPYLQLHYQEPAWDVAQDKAAPERTDEGEGPQAASLDATDRQIIGELSLDGRLPFQAVAETVGISESQVRKRVTRMIGDRVLRITAIANPRSLGFGMQVWVAIRCRPGQGIEALARLLTKIPSITYVVACAGRFDIFAEAVCRDAQDVMRLIDSEIRTLPGVERTELLMCLDLYYRAVRPAERRTGDGA
ncbi:Lrp/AsnC family transcriptional regulator [Streptomyces cellulosae]|uniref:Lrp/AsnC family transcriptional regulator n=1 Tax=Streptomyces cellulosae TaxID=1968 RepID=UPI00224E28EA|nr:Lrp/AsnC family transcriptional regulator [Streptomyces cellulosae]WTB88779.1 Lrp/AsnC family transcriptional regulator [Streptomyces cellulosae]WTC56072.1 Lrp/AsnC family transcriptional regulator [Streptomyces cellulosae]